jgi:hypothetical protein
VSAGEFSDLRDRFSGWHSPVPELLAGTEGGAARVTLDRAFAFSRVLPGL